MKSFKCKYEANGIGMTRYEGEVEVSATDRDSAEGTAIRLLRNQSGGGVSITITDIQES
jgi:hypothetical protein